MSSQHFCADFQKSKIEDGLGKEAIRSRIHFSLNGIEFVTKALSIGIEGCKYF